MSRATRVSRQRKSSKPAEAQRGQRLALECLEDRRLLAAPNPFELSSLLPENGGDGTAGFVFNGIDAGTSIYSGSAVSGAGDINGDGFDDLLIGVGEGDRNGYIQARAELRDFWQAERFCCHTRTFRAGRQQRLCAQWRQHRNIGSAGRGTSTATGSTTC